MADRNDMFTYGVRNIWRTIEQKKPVVTFLRDRYFPNIIESNTKMIDIETRRKGNMVLPSVTRGDSALYAGAIAPHQVETYIPPYFNNHVSVGAKDMEKRVFGEPVGQPYSKDLRAQINIAEKLYGLEESYTLGEESYVSQLLRTGQVTVKGMKHDGSMYLKETINFEVDGDLVGGSLETLWTTSSDIIGSIKTECLRVFAKSGRMPTEMVVGSEVMAVLDGNTKLMNRLDNRRIEGGRLKAEAVELYPGVAINGFLNIPMVGDIMILSYVNSYRGKEDGEATDMIGAKEILLTSPAWGTMGYGSVYTAGPNGYPDEVAGKRIQHVKFGDVENNWTVKAFLQTAPLPMPTELDAWLCKTVVA